MTLPATVEELLQFLNTRIPEPTPRPGDSHDSIIYDAGRRSVVLELFALREGAIPEPLRQKRGLGRVHRQNP